MVLHPPQPSKSPSLDLAHLATLDRSDSIFPRQYRGRATISVDVEPSGDGENHVVAAELDVVADCHVLECQTAVTVPDENQAEMFGICI